MLTIICVLKTDGDYNKEYVDKLYRGVKANLSCEHRFICLTDDKELLNYENLPYCVSALKNDLDSLKGYPSSIKNYWAKLEIFRLKGSVLYFDLDTVIMGSLYGFVQALSFETEKRFFMLEAFNKDRDFSSGIMAWNGDFRFLCKEFQMSQHIAKYNKWDQEYIIDSLKEKDVEIETMQSCLSGIYSYKHHCKDKIPDRSRIICFHGKPRPHEVGGVFWK